MSTIPADGPLRRPYLPDAGESLLLARPEPDTAEAAGTPGLLRVAERVERFTADSGLSDEDIYADPLLAIPLPLYATRIPAGRRRWHGLNPALLWHPLLWLPTRVAEPYRLTSETEDDRLESTDEWALRVAIELTASGMYDPTTGGWVDILALHDLDVTDPATQARLAAWLDGAPDPDLDRIDLTPYFDQPDEPDWAAAAVQGLIADLFGASWSLVASDLRAMLAGARYAPADAPGGLDSLTALARNYLGEAVLDIDITVADRLDDIAGKSEEADGFDEVLGLVESAYRPALAELENLAAAG